MPTGDATDIQARLRGTLPQGWFPADAPNVNALQAGTAAPLAAIYTQIAYTGLQTRLKSATGIWLDIISTDFFGTNLPRLTNETDGAFQARILANLFVRGPTRANMVNVLTLLTGKAPDIFEPSNPTDSGGWSAAGFYWGAQGGWGSPRPYQCLLTIYRPDTALVSLAEWATYTFFWGAYGAWSSDQLTAITDAALIAAVEATRPVGTTVWMRIASAPITP